MISFPEFARTGSGPSRALAWSSANLFRGYCNGWRSYFRRFCGSSIGIVHLPKGQWVVEDIYIPTKESKRPYCFVFRNLGDRLERIAILGYRPEIAQKKAYMYADSIGDSIEMGVPHFIKAVSRVFDECEQIGRPSDWRGDDLKMSYVYTSNTDATWKSHSFISLKSDGIVVGVHSSPFAISPDTIRELKNGSSLLLNSE